MRQFISRKLFKRGVDTGSGSSTQSKSRRSVRAKSDAIALAVCEGLENRLLMSFVPSQITQAYGINQIAYGPNTAGNGAGQTIAIIDPGDDTALVNTGTANFNSSDLHTFDDSPFNTGFVLPDPPSFKVIGESGGARPSYIGISTITESGSSATGGTLTVTTTSANGLSTGNGVTLAEAGIASYDGNKYVVTSTPNSTTFTCTGTTNNPAPTGLGSSSGGTINNPVDTGETTMDVEWAHAIAPAANIVLIEMTNFGPISDYTNAANEAVSLGASVVSMSFGFSEYSGDTGSSTSSFDDGIFARPGVTFIASTGDNGTPAAYPAYSPNVLAVGATNLYLNNDGSYNYETGWSNPAKVGGNAGGSGGGISQYEPQPAYQQGTVTKVTQSTTKRTAPDVSFDGGSSTPVFIYDSIGAGTGNFNDTGAGTSLGAPCWAGLIAIADQGATLLGKPLLNSTAAGFAGQSTVQTLVYDSPLSYFNDITISGYNGYSVGTGYDLVTGIGTPVANLLIPELAFGGVINSSDFTVTNTNNSGPGSLRQAIIDANVYGQPENITFDIPTSDPNYANGAFTIKPQAQLPTITDADLTINGNTQESYTGSTNGGRPVIFLNGSSSIADGLVVSAGSVNIENLGIDSFVADEFQGTNNGDGGIVLTGAAATNDLVEGCLIGVGPNGTSAAGNNQGIQITDGATLDQVGSTSSGDGNVFGDNTTGVAISGASNCSIDGNDIGLTTTLASAPNGTGVDLFASGDNYGNSILNDVICDNTANGVIISGSGSQYSYVEGCDIGVTYSGSLDYFAAANGGDGVLLNDGATANQIGGAGSGGGDIIAGNTGDGVEIDDGNSNSVLATTIGEATHIYRSGQNLLTVNNPNAGDGVYIHDGAAGNQIGSDTTNNVISGNGLAGILFGSDAGTGNLVDASYIGTNSAAASIGNGNEGILIFSSGETVRGDVISCNNYSGMSIVGNLNSVIGNRIGLDTGGSVALPNLHEGIYLSGNTNTISGNFISGNDYTGISVVGCSGNTIANNYIGLNHAGNAAIPNQEDGIGDTGTSNTFLNDVVSGNVQNGVNLQGGGNTVSGCYIGTNAAGSGAIPNQVSGVLIGSASNTISGDTISGNTGVGVQLNGSSNTVTSCTIGLNAAGTAALSNGNGGIEIAGGNNVIGAPTHASGGNTITSSSQSNYLDDIDLETSSASGNLIDGNYIGTNAAGTAALGDAYMGIFIDYGAASNSIVGNVLSGCYDGIEMHGGGTGNATTTTVQGNLIGTDYTGTNALPNAIGIDVGDGASSDNIGGAATGQGNTIDYNSQAGVIISSADSTGTPGASMTGCTLYDNGGVGIVNESVLSLYNCTVTGTVHGGDLGDGIENAEYITLNVYDSTIAENAGTGITGNDTTPFLENTIVAQNTAGDVNASVSGSYNLIGNGTGLSGISNGVNGNKIGTSASPINPQLGALTNNGGTTATLLPQSTSPAINAGTGLSNINTDQRGYARPTSGTVDIGAVQHQGTVVSIPGAVGYFRLDSTGQTLDLYLNSTGTGTPSQTYPVSSITSLSITGSSGNDQLTIDYSNGNLTPAGVGISYDGLGGANTLEVIGTAGNDTISYGSSTVSVGSSTISYANVQQQAVDPLGGTDSLSIASGVYVYLAAAPTGGGILTRKLSSLTLGSNAALAVRTSPNRSTDRTLLVIQALSIGAGATLDLGGNNADISGVSLATANTWVRSGYNGGTWTGTGINSSYAGGIHLTALGVIQNNQGGSPLFTSTAPFDGTVPGASDVLIKYTYYGDANLDGKVNGSDYSRIDNGSLNHLTSWFNGDFNYDGILNGSDYTIIDNAYNTQGASLAARIEEPKPIAPPVTRRTTAVSPLSNTPIDSDEKRRLTRAVFQIGLNLE